MIFLNYRSMFLTEFQSVQWLIKNFEEQSFQLLKVIKNRSQMTGNYEI